MERGLIHIYCGDGKGKTTAALGLAMRFIGRDGKVLLVQFLKSQDSGELATIERMPEITCIRGKEDYRFSFQMNEEQKASCRAIQNENLERAIQTCRLGQADLLILDEVVGALDKNLLDKDRLLEFLRTKPQTLEVVLTGRNPCEELLRLADYVSEIRKVKHPYDRGIAARNGIER